jgi:hypothetical protein
MLYAISIPKLDKKSISEVSRFSKSRDSELFYLNPGQSPMTKEMGRTDESSSSENIQGPSSDFFILKRKFLNKKVAVVRRRHLLPIASQEIRADDLELPKVQTQALSLGSFPEKKKEDLIPLYEYQRFRFEETCKRIDEIRAFDLEYRTQRLKTSKSKDLMKLEKKLFTIKKFSEFNIEKSKRLKEKSKDIIAHEQKFLPARRRHQNFFVNQLV